VPCSGSENSGGWPAVGAAYFKAAFVARGRGGFQLRQYGVRGWSPVTLAAKGSSRFDSRPRTLLPMAGRLREFQPREEPNRADNDDDGGRGVRRQKVDPYTGTQTKRNMRNQRG
jgi:hypothetical protein